MIRWIRRQRPWWCAIVALIGTISGRAQAGEETGAFAIRGGSARAAILGEAYGALGGDADVALWNPAALITIEGPHLQATYHDVYGLGLAHHSSLALAWRQGSGEVTVRGDSILVAYERHAGPAFGVGLSVLGVDLGDESYYELAPAATAAFPLRGGGAVGVTARVLRASSGLDGVSAIGYAFDLGVIRPWGRHVRTGLTFRNALSRLSWDGGQSESPTRELVAAVALSPLRRASLLLGGATDLDDQILDRVNVAIEAALWEPHWSMLAGWEGRRSGDDIDGHVGVGTRLSTDGIAVDYGFIPGNDTPGNTHRITLTIRL